MSIYVFQKSRCPVCSGILNAHTPAPGQDERPPEPGDNSVCAHCSAVLIWTPALTLRAADADEAREVYAGLRKGAN